jgi:uncharacterized membrane-anchored protein YhcB (DUF1043 family)
VATSGSHHHTSSEDPEAIPPEMHLQGSDDCDQNRESETPQRQLKRHAGQHSAVEEMSTPSALSAAAVNPADILQQIQLCLEGLQALREEQKKIAHDVNPGFGMFSKQQQEMHEQSAKNGALLKKMQEDIYRKLEYICDALDALAEEETEESEEDAERISEEDDKKNDVAEENYEENAARDTRTLNAWKYPYMPRY